MNILKSILFTVVLIKSVSLQQSLVCLHCEDCYSMDSSFWQPRTCDDDSPPPGGQTTPGIPILPQYSAQNETMDVVPLVEQASSDFQCYTITQEVGGRHRTNRGCTVRSRNDDETCRLINPGPRTIWCDLCDNNSCNNSGTSRIALSSSLLLAFLFFIKTIVLH